MYFDEIMNCRKKALHVGLFYLLILTNCSLSEEKEHTMELRSEDIRKAYYAGSWYPGNPKKLRNTIEEYMDSVELIEDAGSIIGIIAPHAGYPYSGRVAASGIRQVRGKTYDVVVVIATNHHERRLQFNSVWAKGGYETPLGVVPVDVVSAGAIANYKENDSVKASNIGHTEFSAQPEHSLELELPFLQVALGEFTFVPVVMGAQDLDSCKELAEAIKLSLQGKRVLIVASSDLTHSYSYNEVTTKDALLEKRILEMDPEKLYMDFRDGKCQACGAGPIITAMIASKLLGANTSQVVMRTNSGDITGDRSGYVVGYLSAIFSKADGKTQKTSDKKAESSDSFLTDEDKKTLLKIARASLESSVKDESMPDIPSDSPRLKDKCGGFVTLTKKGQLRGCIGYTEAYYPLAQTIQEMAEAAALKDTRFMPVQPSELDDIDIEISVLTPSRRITDVNEIEVGTHGIIISKGRYTGLLLPQVATEYGWNRETFLEHTCRKAMLPLDAWKDKDTVIEIFSAEIFHE